MTREEEGFECCLKPVPQSAREARDLVALAWSHWELGADDTARLIASELVTNSIIASQEMGEDLEIRMVCRLSDGCPVIEVWDEVDALPEERDPTDEDLGGRGLPLITDLCGGWTVERRPRRGKVVRVVLRGHA